MFRFGITSEGFALGRRNVHYSWVIVSIASMMWMTSSGMRFATSLLIPEFHKEEYFGWSIGFITLGFTIQWLASGFLAPLSGWLGDRYGVRRVMWAGAILFIAGMLLTGTMTTLWEFYIYFGILLAAGMASFQVTLVAGVTLWFKKRLGLAMGLLQSLQGFGTAVAIITVFILFDRFGLRATFWIPGLIGGGLLLFLTRYFYNEPADLGLTPWGANEDEPVKRMQNNELAKTRTRIFLKQAQKTTAFWNLVGIHFWGCAAHNIILILMVDMAREAGLSDVTSVVVYITLTVISTITRFGTPVLADIFGAKTIMFVCFSAQTFPLLILLVSQDVTAFFIFAVLFGIGLGGEMTAFPIINRQYFGRGPMGSSFGWQQFGAGSGMAMGAWVGGALFWLFDSYTATILVSTLTSVVGAAVIMSMEPTSRMLIPNWEDTIPAVPAAADD